MKPFLPSERSTPQSALRTIACAGHYLARDRMTALANAKAERPHYRALHDAIEKGAVTVSSTTSVTAFNMTAVADIASIVPLFRIQCARPSLLEREHRYRVR